MKGYLVLGLIALCCSLLVAAIAADSLTTLGTVYVSPNGTFSYTPDVYDTNGVAFGGFEDFLNKTGWGVLKIETNPDFDDVTAMYAAGYLEGALTQARIYEQYENMYYFFWPNSTIQTTPPQIYLNWFNTQDLWARTQIESNPDSPYWQTVNFILNHYDGLVAGYQANCDTPLPAYAFQILNGVGDLLDLTIALAQPEDRPDYTNMTEAELRLALGKRGHCSGLIKVTGNYSNLFAAHSSWFTYGAMNRIFKHYYFNLNAEFFVGKKMSFSSYPGFLESLDDFYLLGQGLVMVQTTNSIINTTIYDAVTSSSLLAWHRVRLANAMATNGSSWAELVSEHNSGTYNNQYMLVDMNLFTPGQPLPPNLLWVVEQIPGLMVSADVTQILTSGYWASYNVPFFYEIYIQSGYPSLVEQYGPRQSYQLAPRAQIFRRDQSTVVDIPSLQNIMRYNDYESDPYSEGDPGAAVCSRFDLEPTNPSAFGCIDSKVTDYFLSQQMQAYAINGPTSVQQPTWKWVPEFDSEAHHGQPTVYGFPFIEMDPLWEDA